MAKMQDAKDEGAGSVLKNMAKPETDNHAADWLLCHTAFFVAPIVPTYMQTCRSRGTWVHFVRLCFPLSRNRPLKNVLFC